MAADAPPPPNVPLRLPRGRRYAVRLLLVLATVLTIAGTFAVWANRQVLNADNWANTSTALLQDQAVRTQVSAYLVDQLYANVDVNRELAGALPPRLKPLAGPAAGGLRTLAERVTTEALGRPRVQEAWRAANRVTAQQFINIAEGKSGAITAQGNAVFLDLRVLLTDIAGRVGLPQTLVGKIPPGAGRIKIMTADQVGALQDGTAALRSLAIVLPALAFVLFALAVFLARGRRRPTLLAVGIDLVLAGAIVLVARRLAGDAVVDSLVKVDSVKPAAQAAWSIGTGMLRDVAQAVLIVGIPVILAAWLAGPSRPALALRRWMAPWLRERPDVTYAVVGLLLLLIVAWGPIPATRKVIPVLIMIGLVILGVEALRRQVALELPDRALGEGPRLHLPHLRRMSRGGGDGTPPAGNGGAAAPPPPAARVDALERLAALHDRGVLTDEEFAQQKREMLGSGAPR